MVWPCSKARSTPDLRSGSLRSPISTVGRLASSACSSRDDGLRLQLPPFAGEPQMHADDADAGGPPQSRSATAAPRGSRCGRTMGRASSTSIDWRARMTLPWWPRLCGRSEKRMAR